MTVNLPTKPVGNARKRLRRNCPGPKAHKFSRPSGERAGVRTKPCCWWILKRPERHPCTKPSPVRKRKPSEESACHFAGQIQRGRSSGGPWWRLLQLRRSPLLACAGEAPSPPPTGVQPSQHRHQALRLAEPQVIRATAEAPEDVPVERRPCSPKTANPIPTIVVPRPTPTLTPLPPLPQPTPHPGNSRWVRHRVDAVALPSTGPRRRARRCFTAWTSGRCRESLGSFGSYGFYGWAGVGEAKPIPLMHELGHSYWGGFPVIGRPDLVWRRLGSMAKCLLPSPHTTATSSRSWHSLPTSMSCCASACETCPGLSSEQHGTPVPQPGGRRAVHYRGRPVARAAHPAQVLGLLSV